MLKYVVRLRGDVKNGVAQDIFKKYANAHGADYDPEVEERIELTADEMVNSIFYPIFMNFFTFNDLDKDGYFEHCWCGVHTILEVIEVE